MRSRLAALLALSMLPILPIDSTAQLGGRPAAEWAATLESGRRLEGLDIENVVRALDLRAGQVVADIGAGTGIFSVPLAQAVGPTGSVLAVEIDAGFFPMIEAHAREAGVSNVTTVLGEFGDPKLPRRDVELAFFHDVLHHIENREGYLLALADYVAPGGRVAIVDFRAEHPDSPHRDDPEMLVSQDQVTEWMGRAGFELVEEVALFDEKFYVIFRKR